MKELEKYIHKAESKWLEQLYSFCQELFKEKQIPSHNHTHHLRVWEYSKEILHAISINCNVTFSLVESCLIASLLHDIGLSINLGEYHGKESCNICIKYFEDNNLSKPKRFEEILFAIEKHDDKDYKINSIAPDSVLSILCNADDLDAFGKVGVIRYTEIYLLRGFNINNLPELVIKNLDKRFNNFKKTFKCFPDLYAKHKSRYLSTRTFFEDLSNETI